VCPDQLGPAVSRELGDRLRRGGFPARQFPGDRGLGRLCRNRRACEPEPVRRPPHRTRRTAQGDLVRLGSGYLNFGTDCQVIANDLANNRVQQRVVAERGSDTPFEIFEGESLYRYPPS